MHAWEAIQKTLDEPIDFIGVEGYVAFEGEMPTGEQTGIDTPGEIWKRFHLEKHRMPIKPNARSLGASYYGDAPEGYFTCFTGEEMMPESANDEFKTWTLPARTYIVCGFKAETVEELNKSALGKAYSFTQTWMLKNGLIRDNFTIQMFYKNEEIYSEWWIPVDMSDE